MSFEFQRFITIGQYLPTGSPLHRLDARARLLGGALLLGAISAASHLTGVVLALSVLLLLLMLARVPLGYAVRGLLPPFPFILFLAMLQLLFGPQTDTLPLWLTLGPFQFSAADINVAIMLLLRFAALILGISLISFCIATTELVHGLEALFAPLTRLGLPTHDFILMLQVALRFLPLLAREAERIAKAQASRGAEWDTGRGGLAQRVRQVLPLLVPLFLTALQRAEALALAMEARGYTGGKDRTSLVALHFRPTDGIALLLATGLAGLIVCI